MATTLLQARSQLVMQSGIDGNKDFPEPILNRYLNLAQKYVQKILNGLGMKQWEKAWDLTPLLTTASYNGVPLKFTLISDIVTDAGFDVSIEPNSLRLIEVGNGASLGASTVFGIAKIADEQVFHKLLENPYSGALTIKEARFMWQDQCIFIAPNTIGSAKIHLYAVVQDLGSDASSFEVPDEFIEQVIKRAQIDVMDQLKQLQNKDEAIQALDKQIKDQYQAYYTTITQQKNETQMSKLQ